MNALSRKKGFTKGKIYYSISEVAELTGVEQHVLRYWESEFPKLRPKKNRAGNRQYRDRDIKIIRYIKHLLHNDMYTVQGAKKKLMESGYKEVEGQLNLLTTIPKEDMPPESKSAENKVKQEPSSDKDEKKDESADQLKLHKQVLGMIKNELEDVLQLLK